MNVAQLININNLSIVSLIYDLLYIYNFYFNRNNIRLFIYLFFVNHCSLYLTPLLAIYYKLHLKLSYFKPIRNFVMVLIVFINQTINLPKLEKYLFFFDLLLKN